MYTWATLAVSARPLGDGPTVVAIVPFLYFTSERLGFPPKQSQPRNDGLDVKAVYFLAAIYENPDAAPEKKQYLGRGANRLTPTGCFLRPFSSQTGCDSR